MKRSTGVKGAELKLRIGRFRMHRRLLIFAVIILASCGVFGYLPLMTQPVRAQQPETSPYVGDEEAIKEAEDLYIQICSHCHGMKGEGGIGTSLNDSRWVKVSTDKAIFGVIARGRKNTTMTPYLEALGEDMIWKMVVFMRKLQEGGA